MDEHRRDAQPHRLGRRPLVVGAASAVVLAATGGVVAVTRPWSDGAEVWPPLDVVTRAEVGIREEKRIPLWQKFGPVNRKMMEVVTSIYPHHTVDCGVVRCDTDGRNPASRVLGMFESALASGEYSDLQYQLLIDPVTGERFEGRSPYDPIEAADRAGESYNGVDDRGQHPQGAHAIGDNERSFGIAFIADFRTDPLPTDVGMASFADAAARVALRNGFGPFGTYPATFAAPDDSGLGFPEGYRLGLPTIRPHNSTFKTECPSRLAETFPALRVAIAHDMRDLDLERAKTILGAGPTHRATPAPLGIDI